MPKKLNSGTNNKIIFIIKRKIPITTKQNNNIAKKNKNLNNPSIVFKKYKKIIYNTPYHHNASQYMFS